MNSVWASGSDFRAWSRVAVLAGSVSTKPAAGPGQASLAIRSAGKCGSIGRYTPPALKTAKNSSQPIQIALDHHRHHTLTAQPARQQRPSQPVGTSR